MLEVFKDLENQIIIEYYKNFVGEKEVENLVKQFNVEQFCRKWDQVLTSRSTGLFGTGITYSSVNANYSINDDGSVKVVNKAYDTHFEPTIIEGNSVARDDNIPTCRTVIFPSVNVSVPGNYWIIYISPTFDTIIVAAPLILPFIPIDISNNFGVYVLAKDRNQFWESITESTLVFDVLKKYGFTNLLNSPILSGESYSI
jgi:lipocalin